MKPAGSPLEAEETSDDELMALLADGLPLLHSQAIYIRNLECELQSLVAKVKYFTDLERRYKADLDELNYKCDKLMPGVCAGGVFDNPLSYGDQLSKLHQLQIKLEVEQRENQRLQ